MKTNTRKNKPLSSSIAITIAMLSTTALAVDTASSVPFGIIKKSIAASQLNLIHPTTLQGVPYQGEATFSGTSVTVAGGNPYPGGIGTLGVNHVTGASDEPSHYVEVLTGASAGERSNIVAATGTVVTTAAALAATGTQTIRVVEHRTIGKYFGNTNTFSLVGDPDPTVADSVLIYRNASSQSFWYYTGTAAAVGWYDVATSNSAIDAPIAPDDGVIVDRKAGTGTDVVSLGPVKTGNTGVTINQGLNVLGVTSVAASSTTPLDLDNSGLQSVLLAVHDPTVADNVLIYGNGVASLAYWYYNGTAAAVGWYGVFDSNPHGDEKLPPGDSFVVEHKPASTVTWTVPAPASF